MTEPPSARRVAVDLLERVERDGAYANLVVPRALEDGGLSERDRAFVTELVYGTVRRQRACDHLVDRFLHDPAVDPSVRTLLRVGAYQLEFLDTPPHAAVSATVDAAPRRVRGLVNAVLRRVAESDPGWPDEATRLSYPDWIIDRLSADLGHADAVAALESMNRPAMRRVRADGYVQDQASEWAADEVGAGPGDHVLDLCAAPGGKATAMAATGAFVVACDRGRGRVRLLASNMQRWGAGHTRVIRADAGAAPLRDHTFDRVLVDAPCSGLGALGRRPDARWRIDAAGVDRLAALQRRILARAVELVRPGGLLAYSVCTMTEAETLAVDRWLTSEYAELEAVPPVGDHWRAWGSGGIVLPQDHGTDGMAVFLYRRTSDGTSRIDSRTGQSA